MKKWSWILVAAFGAITLFVAVFAGISNGALASQAPGWSQTEGQVVSNGVYRDHHRRRADGYSPQARYTYLVGGQTYSSNRIWLVEDEEWPSHEEAVAVLNARFPVGGTVAVHYDPADPARAALILQEADPGKWLLVGGVGLALIVTGLFLRRRT